MVIRELVEHAAVRGTANRNTVSIPLVFYVSAGLLASSSCRATANEVIIYLRGLV